MMKFISIFLLLLLASQAQSQFVVYREFFFTGQPSATYFDGLGFKASHGVYEAEVTGGTASVQQSRMISTAQATQTNYSLYQNRMWYDIEYLDTRAQIVGDAKAHANAIELAKFIGWAKKAAPRLDIGLFAMVPVTDLWISGRLSTVQQWNNLLQVLADTLDFLSPAVYLYYSETKKPYSSYAGATIQEAKRLAKGKKVFAFVAPGYHPAGDFDNQYASYSVWMNVLNTIKNSGADGMFIFAGRGAMGSQYYDWARIDTSGWWRATKDFMKSLPASGNLVQLDGDNSDLVQEQPDLPTAFGLDQNFPNPFNPTTTIRFSLPEVSHVKLIVYNSLGQQVRTLVDDMREAGYHQARFDASGLASGVYYYRIVASSYIYTRKLLLLK